MLKPAVLIVEDEESDRLFLKTAFEAAEVRNPIIEVGDGREALAYFSGEGHFARRDEFPIPYLVLLDLKLPYVMGLDVLKWIKAQESFRSVVVIVFSSSNHPSDIATAYESGASSYLVKPATMAHLRKMVNSIKDFWLVENQPAPGSMPTAEARRRLQAAGSPAVFASRAR